MVILTEFLKQPRYLSLAHVKRPVKELLSELTGKPDDRQLATSHEYYSIDAVLQVARNWYTRWFAHTHPEFDNTSPMAKFEASVSRMKCTCQILGGLIRRDIRS